LNLGCELRSKSQPTFIIIVKSLIELFFGRLA